MKESTAQILSQLNQQDESTLIEAKACTDSVDRSILETICAFSNEPGIGEGTIVLGIRPNDFQGNNRTQRYRVIGITDTDKIQRDLSSQCATMFNMAIRPDIFVDSVRGKNIIIVRIAELPETAKPLYFRKEGLPRGAYRRIGATDQRCTEDDMPLFYTSADSLDRAIIFDSTMDDVDEAALSRYRDLRRNVNPQAEELAYDDEELLLSLCACKRGRDGILRLTYTGLIVFGKAIAQRRMLPAVRTDYVRVPGTEWVQDPDRRFDKIDMRGPLILLVSRAYNAIVDDLPRGFILPDGNLQAESPVGIPGAALREAIVNAFIHRSYRINQPVMIIRYGNRIEITNPGFSLKPEDSLGEPGSVLRNPSISAIFHETNLAETKGSGIGAMRKLMDRAGMIPPTFDSDHSKNRFSVCLLMHHLMGEDDLRWLASLPVKDLSEGQKVAMVFVKEVGAIDNQTYRQLTNAKRQGAAKALTELCNDGLLLSKGKGNATYYVSGDLFPKPTDLGANLPTSGPKPTDLGSNLPTSGPKPTDLLARFPEELQLRIKALGKKADKAAIFSVVEDLCGVMDLGISEIALLIHRNENYTKRSIVQPLREAGRIQYTIPEMVNHPAQKYRKIWELSS